MAQHGMQSLLPTAVLLSHEVFHVRGPKQLLQLHIPPERSPGRRGSRICLLIESDGSSQVRITACSAFSLAALVGA